MFNKEFLKTLTILYVEDDDTIRDSLSNIFTKIFKKVIISNDGDDGLKQYIKYTKDKNLEIDLIISDINMPNTDGLEMVQSIREFDQDIPIIFTTGHNESKYLMRAINLKISYYAHKPINTTELLNNISKFCMIEYNKKQLESTSRQVVQYMEIINTITSIFKLDTKGFISDANPLICEISQYSKEELIGMHIDIILRKETSNTTFKETLTLISQNELFKTKLKFTSKYGNIFYFNTTIITIKNEYKQDIIGYIYICIDQTEDEIEKQQTMHKVRKNIIEQRTKESNLLKSTKELEEELIKIKFNYISYKDGQALLKKLEREKQKVLALNSQVFHYEQEIIKLKQQKEKVDENDKNKRIIEMKKREKYVNETVKLQSKVIELQSLISKQVAQNKATFVD